MGNTARWRFSVVVIKRNGFNYHFLPEVMCSWPTVVLKDLSSQHPLGKIAKIS